MSNQRLRWMRTNRWVARLRERLPHALINVLIHLPRAIAANIVYGFPGKKLRVIGVTGTKGKTTTAHMLYHVLKSVGRRVVLVSTIGAFFGEEKVDTGLHVTNPEPFTLQKLLLKAFRDGFTDVVLEVTSHGLAQFRNWGIPFALGVYTRVSSDHLPYHGGTTGYRKAKAKLLQAAENVVLNQRDPSLAYLEAQAKKGGLTPRIYKAKNESFQDENREAAITAAGALGVPREKAIEALRSFPGVPGRMETILGEPFRVIIDFAHTPESLEAVLKHLRTKTKKPGRLIAVFGCAGERDPGRRRMGAVAAELADMFIITAEDPRTEGVEKISDEIVEYATDKGATQINPRKMKGFEKRTKSVFARIPDRRRAIQAAIGMGKPGDVIGLFGKGHEESMCFGVTEYPWSEHQAAKEALRKREHNG